MSRIPGRVLIIDYDKDNSYGYNHCCQKMTSHLKDGDKIHINYKRQWRRYGIHYKEGYGRGMQLMHYCPWCGSKLPGEVTDEWFDELEKLGYDDVDIFSEDIPEEFETDEWWIKRGL